MHPCREALGRQVNGKSKHQEKNDRPETPITPVECIAGRKRAPDNKKHKNDEPGELCKTVRNGANRGAGR